MKKKSLICKIFDHKWKLFYGMSSEDRSKDPSAHCERRDCECIILHALQELKDRDRNRHFNKEFRYCDER